MDAQYDLTCRELVELVTDFLEGALTPEERVRFEQHLVFCPGCADHLEQMRQTIRLVGELHEEQISPEAQSALLAAFHTWRQAESPRT